MDSKRPLFKFYRSYFEVGQELSDKDRLAFYDALLNRQFFGIEPILNGISKLAYISQKHSIDAQIKGWEDKTKSKLFEPITAPIQGGIQGGSVQKEIEIEIESKKEIEIKSKIPYDEIIGIFNSLCVSLPSVQKISDQRKKKIDSIIKEYSFEELGDVFKKTAESDFLSGRSGKWKASFDWVLEKKNFLKILEGNYENNKNINNGRIEKTNREIFDEAINSQAARDFRFS